MGRFIITENYKRVLNGRVESTSNYGINRVNDLTDASEDNWLVKNASGTKYLIQRTTSSISQSYAVMGILAEKCEIINGTSLSSGNIKFGTGGADADKDTYSISELVTASTFTKIYTPSNTLYVVTYTNNTNSAVSFDQVHMTKGIYLISGTSTSGTATQQQVLFWIYDFGETITVAPNETVSFTIKIA